MHIWFRVMLFGHILSKKKVIWTHKNVTLYPLCLYDIGCQIGCPQNNSL